MPVRRLNHAVLYVRNVDRSAAFYGEQLGFRTLFQMPGKAAFMLAPGSTNDHDLGLFQIGEGARPSDAGSASVGLYHLAWEVDTLAELKRLRDVLSKSGALVGASDHSTTKALYAKDPDGLEFEVCWIVPADLLTEDVLSRRTGILPLDLDAEIARYGAETVGGLGSPVPAAGLTSRAHESYAMRVAVLGGGSWGTTMGSLLAPRHQTILWARDPDVARAVDKDHANPVYLPGFDLSPDLRATSELEEATSSADLLIVGVPTSGFRKVLEDAKLYLRPWVPVVSLSKGLERSSLLRMTEVIKEVLPGHPAAALTGPNIAKEILSGQGGGRGRRDGGPGCRSRDPKGRHPRGVPCVRQSRRDRM